MAAPLLQPPPTRANGKLLAFPVPRPAQTAVTPAAPLLSEKNEADDPRHSALLLMALAVIALLLYFSAAFV